MSEPRMVVVDGESFAVDHHAGGLRLTGLDARLESLALELPTGWTLTPAEDVDEFCWRRGELRLRLRLRTQVQLGIDVDLTNGGDDVAQCEPPVLRLAPSQARVPWLAGAAGEVVVDHPEGPVVLRQVMGACAAAGHDIALFVPPVLLRPGQALGSRWRAELWEAGQLVPEPAWLPERRHEPVGVPVVLDFPDGGLVAPGLQLTTEGTLTQLRGPAGLHTVELMDARGVTAFEVGWHPPVDELVDAALGTALPPDLAVWLRSNRSAELADVDGLDLLAAESLADPSLWGALAGLRLIAFAGLPLGTDVRSAVAELMHQHAPDSPELLLLAVHAARLGMWDLMPDEVGGAFDAPSREQLPGARPTSPSAQAVGDILRRLDQARVSSLPPGYGGRDVAVAQLHLALRPDGVVHAQLARALQSAEARLLCHWADRPDAEGLAWYLAAPGTGQ